MEAKDTVMTEKEIQTELNYACEAMEFIPLKDQEMNKCLRVARLQAEISFKAGIREMVGWVEMVKPRINMEAGGGYHYTISLEQWQAKLKTLNISA